MNTKQVLNHAVLLSLAALMTACGATKIRRTLETDSMLRVLIDPRIDEANYVQVRRALVQSGKFEVIDRRDGFQAALAEQDLQFRSGMSDRFSDREKWSRMGQMYGAQGIIEAHADCYQKKNFWGVFSKYCKQDLAFIDGVTGKVEFAVAGENSEEWIAGFTVPDWNDVVDKFVGAYPDYYKPRIVKFPLDQYMDQSEEHGRRQRESQMPAPRAMAAPIHPVQVVSQKFVDRSEQKLDDEAKASEQESE